MDFFAKEFSSLTVDELYELLKSRAEIFLLEQEILYQDLDDVDKNALHCFFFDGKRVNACLRAFRKEDDTVMVGRVLTLEHRNGLGKELMTRSIEEIKKHFGCKKICVHAQKRSSGFYEKLGFYTTSDEFLIEGIVHIKMELDV